MRGVVEVELLARTRRTNEETTAPTMVAPSEQAELISAQKASRRRRVAHPVVLGHRQASIARNVAKSDPCRHLSFEHCVCVLVVHRVGKHQVTGTSALSVDQVEAGAMGNQERSGR
jgi:hypothetical protein